MPSCGSRAHGVASRPVPGACAVSPLDTALQPAYSRSMSSRITKLQRLRQERHPLVALATLAFAMRLVLLVLASALSPDAAVAAGLTSLCQPSGQEQSLPGPHNPLTCQCGPVCAHGCAIAPCLASTAPLPDRLLASAANPHFLTRQQAVLASARRTAAIRAPPSLI